MTDTVTTGTETAANTTTTTVGNDGTIQATQSIQTTQANTPVDTSAGTAQPNTQAGTGTTQVTPPAQWFADDWREKMAGGDTKVLERLQRFSDPSALWNSYKGLETKVSSGQVKLGLPDNPTPEQVSQFRKDNNVPEAATDYKLEFNNGFLPSEKDMPIINHMMGILHEANASNATVNKVMNGYYEIREAEAAYQVEQQKSIRASSEDQLRQQWGGNFRPNLMAVQNLLASAPTGVMEMIDQAVLPDGSKLGNNVAALSWLASMAREINPAGTVVPGATGNQLDAIGKEKDELLAFMNKDINAWRKDTGKQARFRELVNAELKLQRK